MHAQISAFSCAIENKVDANGENVSGNMQRTSFVFYIIILDAAKVIYSCNLFFDLAIKT